MNNDRKGTAFVITQILLIGIYLLAPHYRLFEVPEIHSWVPIAVFAFGLSLMALAALQLNRNLSPFPSPKKKSRLITSGAYKYVRHPIYTGFSFRFRLGDRERESNSAVFGSAPHKPSPFQSHT